LNRWAFFITFGGYFMAHFSRKCYSTVKQQLQTDAGYSAFVLSEMDTIFMATYAAGNIINGKLGDTFNPTSILAIGLFGSGICLLFINVLIWLNVELYSAMLGNVLILGTYFLFGFFQATGGPVGTAVMGNWFCDADAIKKRGTIFGFWTCHQYCGDITAALCTAWVLGMGFVYWWALLIPALTNIAWAFLTMQLEADPVNVGIVTPEVRIRQEKMEEKRKAMAEQGQIMEADEGPQPITYMGAFAIPMVAQYSLAFGFFKLTNYCLFFWLPYFLGKTFDPVTANLIAALYSVGMMPGGIIVGTVSDMFGGRRAVVIGVFMCLLMVFLGIFAKYSEAGMSPIVLLAMLGCMGILVGKSACDGRMVSYPWPFCFAAMITCSHSMPLLYCRWPQQHHYIGCRCRFGLGPVGPWQQQVAWHCDGFDQWLWRYHRFDWTSRRRSLAGGLWLVIGLDLLDRMHRRRNCSHGSQDLFRAIPTD
jgi:sugar phosphate permease